MATQLYMSRPRWIAVLIVALSVLLVWWSVAIRLGGAVELDRQRMRQEALEFKITALRWQRDALNAGEIVEIREQARDRLLTDPDSLPELVDTLQDIASRNGIVVSVEIDASQPFGEVHGVSMRDLKLRFSGVDYDLLVRYLGALEDLSDQWVFVVRDLSLASRGGDVEVNGWVEVRFWTKPGAEPEEQDSLF